MTNLYEKLVDLVVREKLGDNRPLIRWLSELDQDVHGLGFVHTDVCKVFKDDAQSLIVLVNLLTKAISDLSFENEYNSELQKMLYAFRDAIFAYAESLLSKFS